MAHFSWCIPRSTRRCSQELGVPPSYLARVTDKDERRCGLDDAQRGGGSQKRALAAHPAFKFPGPPATEARGGGAARRRGGAAARRRGGAPMGSLGSGPFVVAGRFRPGLPQPLDFFLVQD